jgi:hypothetical protein
MRRNHDAPRPLLASPTTTSTTTSNETLPSLASTDNPQSVVPVDQADSPESPTLGLRTLAIDSASGVQSNLGPALRAYRQNVTQLLCSEDSLTDTADSRHTSLGDSDQLDPTPAYRGFAQYPTPVVPQNHLTWYSGPNVCEFPSGQVLACQLDPDRGQLRVYRYVSEQWLVTTYYVGTLVPVPDWYWWE